MPSSRLETYGSGGGGSPVQETPISGVVDGVNTSFGITFFPTTEDAIQVFVDGDIIDHYYWEYSNKIITFINGFVPQLGQEVYFVYFVGGIANSLPNLSGLYQVYYLSPSLSDIINKKITLPTLPSDFSQVTAGFADGVGVLVYGTDFYMDGQDFKWDGKSLDGFIETSDILRITYFS